jgi:hypothetical protein
MVAYLRVISPDATPEEVAAIVAAVGALLGDSARTRILTALLSGCALTATSSRNSVMI